MKCDSHTHLTQLLLRSPETINLLNNYKVLISCHSKTELQEALELREKFGRESIKISMGIVPINPEYQLVETVKKAAEEKKLDALGEFGFDLFGTVKMSDLKIQHQIFEDLSSSAVENRLPVVLHIRKGMDELFKHIEILKKVPAVVFHCYSGSLQQAQSLLKRGVNAFFSSGTPLLKGSKKAAQLVKSLPEDRILFETDAPWQPLRGRDFSSLKELEEIYKLAGEIKKTDINSLENQMEKNFNSLFQ
jgi:TatD DNase family protein